VVAVWAPWIEDHWSLDQLQSQELLQLEVQGGLELGIVEYLHPCRPKVCILSLNK
jgi:hypothetical protein